VKIGLLCAYFLLALATAAAQSSLNGTWKLDLDTLPTTRGPFVWLIEDGIYHCNSCIPPIRVQANGRDQKVSGQPYDTISVSLIDDRTVREVEKKNGQTVSDEKFTVSPDGRTATDEFANWKVSMRRIEKGPSGSHALSGSWQPFKQESVSSQGLVITFRWEGKVLLMSRPTGQSYRARLDGGDAPYHGDPHVSSVSLKRIDANTVEETDKLNGKAVTVARITVRADGKSLTIAARNPEVGTTSYFTATKQ